VEHSGRVAGRLYAISTAGSLLGTMLAALVLVPFAGTQRTFLAFAAALALIAALGLGWRFLALPAALIGALALPVGTIKAAGDARVLYERESALQYIRVLEEPDGDRVLELNEGQARHSLYRPGSYLTGGYWDGMMVLPFTTLQRPPQRVAILGNGAGTMARATGVPIYLADVIQGVALVTMVAARLFATYRLRVISPPSPLPPRSDALRVAAGAGEGRGGGKVAAAAPFTFPPPLTPPRKGEGNPQAMGQS